jgi:hypothetical protein
MSKKEDIYSFSASQVYTYKHGRREECGGHSAFCGLPSFDKLCHRITY